jgi:hypothetical protein
MLESKLIEYHSLAACDIYYYVWIGLVPKLGSIYEGGTCH